MCAINDPQLLAKIKTQTERIHAWKLLRWPHGDSAIVGKRNGTQYGPGWTYATISIPFIPRRPTKRFPLLEQYPYKLSQYKKPLPPNFEYSKAYPYGIHAYLQNPLNMFYQTRRIIAVEIDPKDVLVYESKPAKLPCKVSASLHGQKFSIPQIVARKVWINETEWKRVFNPTEFPAYFKKHEEPDIYFDEIIKFDDLKV